MAAPMLLFQSLLSAFTSGSNKPPPPSQTPHNASTSTMDTGVPVITTPTLAPANLYTLITSLVSVSAMGDWFRLLLLGGFFEFCRRVVMKLFQVTYDIFFITVDIAENDPCYTWIMFWLQTQPSWKNARNIQLGTEYLDTSSSFIFDEKIHRVTVIGERRLSYKPSHFSAHSFWYKRCWFRINRWEKEGTSHFRKKEEFLRLCILSKDHSALNDLLAEAEQVYEAAQENLINIYVSESNNQGWRHLAARRKRPLSSIVLDPGTKDLLVEDAREFLNSKNWYAARGIPFRRGYLLHGEPGSGKTSIIQSLAGELGLDIYIVSLSRAGLDDNALNELISRLPEKCIALMEDIDAAFTATINRDSSQSVVKSATSDHSQPQAQKQQKTLSRVTLSGLLNALDGVAAQEGRLLFATTNKYNTLDPALTRPGRMDLHIEFKLSSKHQARELYRCFYSPDNDSADEVAVESGAESRNSGAASQKTEVSEKGVLLRLDEAASVESEGTTAVPSASTSPSPNFLSFSREHQSSHDQSQSDFGPTTTMSSKSQLNNLAIIFGNMLPEREFSMASLQGYLMMYKTKPVDAVRDFGAWIEKERKERAEKEMREVRSVQDVDVVVDANTPSPTTTSFA